MQGECVGQVEASRADGLAAGDFVRGHGGWQSRFVLPADRLTQLDPDEAPLSTALGVLGMPGLTAYAGLHGDRHAQARRDGGGRVPPAVRSAPSPARSPSSAAAASWASPAVRTSAPMSRTSSASTSASTGASLISPAG